MSFIKNIINKEKEIRAKKAEEKKYSTAAEKVIQDKAKAAYYQEREKAVINAARKKGASSVDKRSGIAAGLKTFFGTQKSSVNNQQQVKRQAIIGQPSPARSFGMGMQTRTSHLMIGQHKSYGIGMQPPAPQASKKSGKRNKRKNKKK